MKKLRSVSTLLFWIVASFLAVERSYALDENEGTSPLVCQSPSFPQLTYDQSHLFPSDRPLARPEDGKALLDGRLVVADETHGLLLIDQEGSHRPFGRLKELGYVHNPPTTHGGAHGVFVEHGGRHVLLSDVYSGKIFRINTDTEETQLLYDHPYGVNSLYRDRQGTIWFTQSSHNTAEGGRDSLWASVNIPEPSGAIFNLVASKDQITFEAKELVTDLYFANGVTFDLSEESMYVAEMNMDRILRFKVDVKTGTLSNRVTYHRILMPDNLAMDADSNLWVASNITSQVVVIDTKCRSLHTVFHATSDTNASVVDEWVRRTHLGQPRGDLLTKGAWKPLPNYLTGVFFSPDFQMVYFTGLGDAVLRYTMPSP